MRKKTYAYAGKILKADLSNGSIKSEPTETYSKSFLGGRGINQWMLFKGVKPLSQPYDPDNPLIFGAGVLVGTGAPAACRCTVEGKNAFFGGVGSANVGGHFAPELKFAGYDHVLVKGRSSEPCYLWINDGTVEIKTADHLWGKPTWETDDIIREELGDEDIQIATIGPAGENMVRAACIICNGARAAARCGLGAVMGSKRLKAVAVRGTGEVNIANSGAFRQAIEEYFEKIRKAEVLRRINELGLACFIDKAIETGSNPLRNFQGAFLDSEKMRKTSSRILKEKYYVRNLACFSCPVACSHYLRVLGDVEGEGIPGNSLSDFGFKLDLDDIEAIIKSYVMCNQYGLDTDNTVGVIAWAFECFEKGILERRDVDGLELRWGNHKAVNELIKKIAFREGVGDILAEGSKVASIKIGRGSEKYAMHIKGQELYESLTGRKGWALGVIVAPRGGGHLNGAPLTEGSGISQEESKRLYGVATAGDGKTYEGKPELVIYFENLKAVVDCLGICYLLTRWTSPSLPGEAELSELVSAATGVDISARELMRIGERIQNLEKSFNFREELTRRDDAPPERFFETVKSGPMRGERPLEKRKFNKMLDRYYKLRNWNKETSKPSKEKLESLGLSTVHEELEKSYRDT